MFSILPTSVLLLIASTALAAPIVESPATINVNHYSKSTKLTTTTTLNASAIAPALAKTIEGSTLNINIIGEREKRHAIRFGATKNHQSRRINNSTINLTVVGGNAKRQVEAAAGLAAVVPVIESSTPSVDPVSTLNSAASAVSTPGHHNVHIDASGGKHGGSGGIHNSTINISLLSRSDAAVGHHSIVVSTASTSGEAAIDGTTMNLNILPRAAIGDHSILIDTSSSSTSPSSSDNTNSAGHHSVVVETKKSGTTGSSAIKDSVINLTVVGGNTPLKRSPSPVRMERRVRA